MKHARVSLCEFKICANSQKSVYGAGWAESGMNKMLILFVNVAAAERFELPTNGLQIYKLKGAPKVLIGAKGPSSQKTVLIDDLLPPAA